MNPGFSDPTRKLATSGHSSFATKVRVGRAVLGWSQSGLGKRVRTTQRAIRMKEQGNAQPRRKTVEALEEIWREQNIQFNDRADGGFEMEICAPALRKARRGLKRRK